MCGKKNTHVTCFRLPSTTATRKMKKDEQVTVTLNSAQGSPIAPTEAAIILPLGNEVGHCSNDLMDKASFFLIFLIWILVLFFRYILYLNINLTKRGRESSRL